MLDPFINFFREIPQATGGGTGIGFDYRADNYTQLSTIVAPVATADQIAYVKNSEGISWLPGSLGGTYYPKGVYIWDAALPGWSSDRNKIAKQLQINIDDIDQLELEFAALDILVQNHINNQNNPHLTSIQNLIDTQISTLQQGDLLQFDSLLQKFINKKDIVFEGNITINAGILFGNIYETPVLTTDQTDLLIPNIENLSIIVINSDKNIDIDSIVAPSTPSDPSITQQPYIIANGNTTGSNNRIRLTPTSSSLVPENTFDMDDFIDLRPGAFWWTKYNHKAGQKRFNSQAKL